MTAHSVIHDTFTIERTYPAFPSRVFTRRHAEPRNARSSNVTVGSNWGPLTGAIPLQGATI